MKPTAVLPHPFSAWRLALLLPIFCLSACGSLLPKPPAAPTRHTLDASASVVDASAIQARATPSATTATAAPVLVVAVPRAAPGHDSTRMVYLQQPQQLRAFAHNEWVDTPAQMLAPLMVRALQDSGAFRVVLLAPSGAMGGLRLETELIRLQQDFTSQPSRVRLTLRAVLLDTATRQAVAWREFDETVVANSESPDGGVQAAHQATQRVLQALALFCAQQVKR
ncbi:MAG: ABC-type transport auxiliary lipoprotein family protein [Rubrivivax sp.]|nr:ABC-type transport auxiliary lipoprotein family protein [Rubrivivax sp.]MDP3612473.1 ABC-type transport auxiliary lipoprotein family protein [Rubrivivax sp.]